MNKFMIFIIILIIAIAVGVGFLVMNKSNINNNVNVIDNKANEQNTNNQENIDKTNNSLNNNINNEKNNIVNNESLDTNNSKGIVIYFSVTGNTEKIAKLIAGVTNSDIQEIIPENEYTSEDIQYTNDNSRANKEQNDKSARPKIKNKINIENYDTIYLGYPIWWGDVPKIILTFMDSYNVDGKKIIPFCTSGSSGIGTSVNTIKNYNKNIIVENGKRFSSSTTKEDIAEWLRNN